jgi:hypothetical protein
MEGGRPAGGMLESCTTQHTAYLMYRWRDRGAPRSSIVRSKCLIFRDLLMTDGLVQYHISRVKRINIYSSVRVMTLGKTTSQAGGQL